MKIKQNLLSHAERSRITSSLLGLLQEKICAIGISGDEPYAEYCGLMNDQIKFLSETLICMRFIAFDCDQRNKILAIVRRHLLHRHAMMRYALNPSLSTWYLNAIAMLDGIFDMRQERRFAMSMAGFFGVLDEDAPAYRNEECKFLVALMNGERYRQGETSLSKRFHFYTRDQVYAATHLLFYRNNYGSKLFHAEESEVVAVEYLLFQAYREKNIDLMLELMISYQAIIGVDQARRATFDHLLCRLISRTPSFMLLLTQGDAKLFDDFHHQALLYLLYINSDSFPEKKLEFEGEIYVEVMRSYLFFSALLGSNYVRAARRYVHVRTGSEYGRAFRSSHFDEYAKAQKFLIGHPQQLRTAGIRSQL